jgi:putative ABC transport system ATP-binding protein
MSGNMISLESVSRTYQMGEVDVKALAGVSFEIEDAEFVAVMGRSGSGKSTLMNVLGCLDADYDGSYTLDGVCVDGLGRNALADLRSEKIGFVFQGFNLLPRTTALENVEMPLVYDRSARHGAMRNKALEALERVGLADRFDHEPTQLSGGQQQRVAIARAIVNEPSILLADEPTGNLDTRTALDVVALFQDLNSHGMTIILVTHEPDIASFAGRIVELKNGSLLSDRINEDRHLARESLDKETGRGTP